MIIHTLSEIKDQLIGLPESPERLKYELDLLIWQLKHGKRKPTSIGMGITNKEGLHLMSSPLINPEQIQTKEFPELDVLGVKITTPLDDQIVLKELRKSFGEDVVKHPSAPRRYVILNWRKHFNTQMI